MEAKKAIRCRCPAVDAAQVRDLLLDTDFPFDDPTDWPC